MTLPPRLRTKSQLASIFAFLPAASPPAHTVKSCGLSGLSLSPTFCLRSSPQIWAHAHSGLLTGTLFPSSSLQPAPLWSSSTIYSSVSKAYRKRAESPSMTLLSLPPPLQLLFLEVAYALAPLNFSPFSKGDLLLWDYWSLQPLSRMTCPSSARRTPPLY